ncbi:hypothetical protein QAD02_015410 [Eretmocerus hayati]|uniref:Uncharacterized protein n=1 Tax=Eretmocerus hayati TaxID=131215 RepID=A0ACC2P955_9HYME|nr:hypothetical protein QAD02_015410 [Eretmocerus hayati]
MKWETEINQKVNATKYLIYVLTRLREILSAQNWNMIMYGLYYSRVTYGIVGWGAANKTQITKSNRVHSKVMKLQGKVGHFLKKPLNLEEKFVVEALSHSYPSFVENYQEITLNTRNKLLSLPKDISKKFGNAAIGIMQLCT